AYDAYLRGLVVANASIVQISTYQNAAAAFRQAVQLDPEFATAWAWLTVQYACLYKDNGQHATDRAAAREALDAATRLAPESAETLLAEGYYRFLAESDYDNAKKLFEQVRRLLPGDNRALQALASIARFQGHYDQSLLLLQRALNLNPRDLRTIFICAYTAMM